MGRAEHRAAALILLRHQAMGLPPMQTAPPVSRPVRRWRALVLPKPEMAPPLEVVVERPVVEPVVILPVPEPLPPLPVVPPPLRQPWYRRVWAYIRWLLEDV